jgi:dUTP pyrophosphatase
MSNIAPWINYNGKYKPEYQTQNSAGVDLQTTEDVTLPAGKWVLLPTGLSMAIPPNFMGMVCPRSGLAAKYGITVLNAPGIVDSDFRGEIKVILINHSNEDYSFKKGDRIAQLIFVPALHSHLNEVDELSSTDRGAGGFGSTGR